MGFKKMFLFGSLEHLPLVNDSDSVHHVEPLEVYITMTLCRIPA